MPDDFTRQKGAPLGVKNKQHVGFDAEKKSIDFH